jgi:hypothetical protein
MRIVVFLRERPRVSVNKIPVDPNTWKWHSVEIFSELSSSNISSHNYQNQKRDFLSSPPTSLGRSSPVLSPYLSLILVINFPSTLANKVFHCLRVVVTHKGSPIVPNIVVILNGINNNSELKIHSSRSSEDEKKLKKFAPQEFCQAKLTQTIKFGMLERALCVGA